MNTPTSEFNIILIIKNAILYFFKDIYTTIIGFLITFIGYILPIKNILSLLIWFFILDVLFGFWAANRIRKEKFSVSIVWQHTMPRMLISIILIICAFMWDKEYHQDIVAIHKIIGWFISGVLLVSIIDNAYQITKWKAFPQISKIIKEKTKENTDLDITT